ncbi:fatty acid desaturase family protein [Solitalea canadensis]|uniref:Fatty acid desaturase n=1 Tax=Solitalea canadensis (strain ATCC 29591 / DSM 3403 / JCM 21819 / LMG 8368 / NBRC 15130 / NCIMB 12057 / USAM 9D) TaxID=929556 RepID=H8KW49_SOLCM|nr:acyl-CoA desaturase [Solitalea canadensis]AFD07070.1 fatty acid desaturase [Solitalea canadensis DSM 3403]
MHTQSVKFKKEGNEDFYPTVKKRVNQYFEDNKLSRHAQGSYFVKIILLVVLYFGLYFNLLVNVKSTWAIYLSYGVIGVLVVLIFLNVVHDAAHEAIFKNKKANRVLVHFLELFGTNNYIWRMRHLESHHIYPNMFGYDVDIKQSPIVRIADNSPYLKYHKFQHFYMPLLYFSYTLNWTLVRDFKDIFDNEMGPKKGVKHPVFQVIILIGAKLFYFFYMLVLPAMILPVGFWTIFGAFIVMHLISSLVALLALISSHVGENAVFPQPDDEGKLSHTWAEHQLIVTSDFAPNSKIVTSLMGGFNLHVVHHLFPTVSHSHYPTLTKIVRQTAADFGITYQSMSLGEAMISHWKLLRKNSFEDMRAILNEA